VDLPDVSLTGPAPAPCPGIRRPRPAAVPANDLGRGGARPDGPAAPVDGRDDAPVDGPVDDRPDGPGDAFAFSLPGVLAVRDPGVPGLPASVRAWLTLRHWATLCGQSARKAATNPRGPYHAQPESLAAHDAYRRSRAWIPAGHEGRILGPAGGAYHHTIARAGLIAGYSLAWVFARPLRLFIAVVVIGGIVLGSWLG
jgi:hypothetical protein